MKARTYAILVVLLAAMLACNMPGTAAPTATPTLTETPTATVTSTATPEPTATVPPPTLEPTLPPQPVFTQAPPTQAAVPTPKEQRVSFEAGASTTTISGTLPPYSANRYVLNITSGALMGAVLTPGDGRATLAIWGANGPVLSAYESKLTEWTGEIPSFQNYYIEVYNTTGGALKYSLFITVPPSNPVNPNAAERISFGGGTTASLTSQMASGKQESYVLRLLKGNTFNVNLTMQTGSALFSIVGDDGKVLETGESNYSSVIISKTQDYYVTVRNVGPTKAKYILYLEAPSMSVTSTPEPEHDDSVQRLDVAGPGDVGVGGQLPSNTKDTYVFAAVGGQTLDAQLSLNGGKAVLVIYSADGTVLLSSKASQTSWSGQLPTFNDYYVEVRNYGSNKAIYTLTLSLH